jgi:hypothetical protein
MGTMLEEGCAPSSDDGLLNPDAGADADTDGNTNADGDTDVDAAACSLTADVLSRPSRISLDFCAIFSEPRRGQATERECISIR